MPRDRSIEEIKVKHINYLVDHKNFSVVCPSCNTLTFRAPSGAAEAAWAHTT